MARWSDAEDRTLRRLWDQGQPYSYIAEILAKPRNAIAGRADRLGLRRAEPGNSRCGLKSMKAKPPWSEHQVEMLRRMRAEGSRNGDIARSLGKTEGAIKAKIKALGLPKPEVAAKPRHRPGPNHQKWQWQRRGGSPSNKRGRNSARSIMKQPADGADAAACMAEVRDAVEALTPRCCRWPIGEVDKPGFRFCGERKESLSRPYCAEHAEASKARYVPKVFRDTALASDSA